MWLKSRPTGSGTGSASDLFVAYCNTALYGRLPAGAREETADVPMWQLRPAAGEGQSYVACCNGLLHDVTQLPK